MITFVNSIRPLGAIWCNLSPRSRGRLCTDCGRVNVGIVGIVGIPGDVLTDPGNVLSPASSVACSTDPRLVPKEGQKTRKTRMTRIRMTDTSS